MNIGWAFEIVAGIALFSFGVVGVAVPVVQTHRELSQATREALVRVRRVEAFRDQGEDPLYADARASVDIVEVLRQIDEHAKTAGVSCEAIRPEGSRRVESNKWRSRRTDVTLVVLGEEGRVRTFIGEIEANADWVARVAALTLWPDRRDAGVVRAQAKIEIVDEARCVKERCDQEGEVPGAFSVRARRPAPRGLFAPLKVGAKTPSVSVDPKSDLRDLRLVGVMDDGEPRAFLSEKGTGSTVSVKKGDDVRGWTVASINEREVVVNHDESEARIER